ncbi:hypothetical protein TrispH2_005980 [Trichoplax sp. H2]|nr:hypothetical protein TrispH2_005980 [Trichoplax sp. H2]|eukprot:RDD42074.1 hypothetical protein TrispH2_005980 [Trichoplax sp. H2]
MASLIRSTVGFLRKAWDKEPILFVSIFFGVAGPLCVYFGPGTQASMEAHKKTPKFYPATIRRPDDPPPNCVQMYEDAWRVCQHQLQETKTDVA